MPLRNYGMVKGKLTGVEHIAINHSTGKPAHLVFYLHTSDGEKQCAFNVFSVDNSSVFVHMEDDLLNHRSKPLQDLARFADGASEHMVLRDRSELSAIHCADYIDLSVGFPNKFNQEDSKRIIDEINALFKAELHELHNTSGRQNIHDHEVAIFGQVYDDHSGIHQVHMNSYAAGHHSVSHSHESPQDAHHGPKQDGALLVKLGPNHWKAVFVAFDTQIRSFTQEPHQEHAAFHAEYHATNPPHPVMSPSHPTYNNSKPTPAANIAASHPHPSGAVSYASHVASSSHAQGHQAHK